MRLVSWNVNGLRACMKKGFVESCLALDADVYCLQETKLQAGQVDLELPGYHMYWNYADKKGYSGTALLTRMDPVAVTCGFGDDIHRHEAGDLGEYSKYGTVALVQEFFSLLSPYHGGDYFPVTDKHGTTFQVYGALEEGFLTAPDFVDRTFPAGDVRGKLPWIHEPIKGNIHKLFDVMKPLTEKYNCTYSNLVQAWTLAQYPNLNLLTGFRRVETMENTCKSLDLQLEAADIALLSEAAKPAQVKVLDK